MRHGGGEPGGRLRAGASGFYPLNTLCNYDRQVIPLLDAPTGSAFARAGAALTPLVPAPADGISREITSPAKGPVERKAPVRRRTAAGNSRKVKVRRIRYKRPRGRKRLYFPSLSDKIPQGTNQRKTEKIRANRREIKFR